MIDIKEIEEYKKLKDNEEIFFIYKHSTICPVSTNALEQLEIFLNKNEDIKKKVNKVHVIEDRPLSNFIADDLEVRHQSPQLLLIKNGKCIWNDSHMRLTAEKIAEIVKENF